MVTCSVSHLDLVISTELCFLVLVLIILAHNSLFLIYFLDRPACVLTPNMDFDLIQEMLSFHPCVMPRLTAHYRMFLMLVHMDTLKI